MIRNLIGNFYIHLKAIKGVYNVHFRDKLINVTLKVLEKSFIGFFL